MPTPTLLERRVTNAERNIAKQMKLINSGADIHLKMAHALREQNVRITALEAYIEKLQGGLK